MARKSLGQPVGKLCLLGKRLSYTGREDPGEGACFSVEVSSLKEWNIKRVKRSVIPRTKQHVMQEHFCRVRPAHVVQLTDFSQFSRTFPIRVQANLLFLRIDKDKG